MSNNEDGKTVVKVGTLVVSDRRRPFGNRRWRVVFLWNWYAGLSRASRAILLTALTEGLQWEGVITLHRGSLTGLYSRPALADALRELEARGILRRKGDLLFVNPSVAFAGPASHFEKTLERWEEDL